MSEIDYSSNYDFNLDPYSENKDSENTTENTQANENTESNEKNQNKEDLKKEPPKQNNGCRLLLIVLIYLVIIESNMNFLVDSLLKKFIFIVILWTFGYDLINKLIGFEKNVCKHLF